MKGDPPFGYKLENKRLVPDENRKEWVQKIYRWYDDSMTTTQIQKILLKTLFSHLGIVYLITSGFP